MRSLDVGDAANTFEEAEAWDYLKPPVINKLNEMHSLVDSGGADLLDELEPDSPPALRDQPNSGSSDPDDTVPALQSKLRSQASWHSGTLKVGLRESAGTAK
jgi:hypothetical protein